MNEYFDAEFRALLDKKSYSRIEDYLLNVASDLGKQETLTHFFVLPKKFLKISQDLTTDRVELALKSSDSKNSKFVREKKAHIYSKDFLPLISLIKDLNITKDISISKQLKHIFKYKNAFLVLKHSDNWGYHIELNIPLKEISCKEDALKLAAEIEIELNIHFLTTEELMTFTDSIMAKNKDII